MRQPPAAGPRAVEWMAMMARSPVRRVVAEDDLLVVVELAHVEDFHRRRLGP